MLLGKNTLKIKRTAAFILTVLLFLIMFFGCKGVDEKPSDTQSEKARELAAERIQNDIETAIWYVEKNQYDGSNVSYPYEDDNSAYEALDDTQKELYDEMLPKIQSLTPFEYTAKEYGYDVLDNVFVAAKALCEMHPECNLYFEIEEVIEGGMTVALRAVYFMPWDNEIENEKDVDAVKEELDIFDEECNLIVESIPEDFSTYDKYRYLATIISLRTTYDNDFVGGKKTSTAYGAIEGPIAICQGYSTAFKYLCKKANLWCKSVGGTSEDVAHAWNIVKLESGTYHVDITWSDADGNEPLDENWQRYFMLTQDEILIDHNIDDGTVADGISLNF